MTSNREGYSVNTPLTLETENVTINFASSDNFCPNSETNPQDKVSFETNCKIKFLPVLSQATRARSYAIYAVCTCQLFVYISQLFVYISQLFVYISQLFVYTYQLIAYTCQLIGYVC